MLKTKKYSVKDFIETPWKNGLGTTLQLAADEKVPPRWRISRAFLSGSAEFSLYPEYDRILTLLEGNEITLTHSNGKLRRLLSYTPYRFGGELNTQSEFQGKGSDFNVFLKKNCVKGNVYPTYFKVSSEMHFPLSGTEHFVYCTEGEITVSERNTNTEFILKKGELLQLTKTSAKELVNLKAMGSASTIALWLILHVES